MNDRYEHDDLTPSERAAWAALPSHRAPPRALEERTVRELRREGLLQVARRATWLKLGAGVAAAAVIFALGLAAGMRLNPGPSGVVSDPALRIQQAGSDYVQALSQLSAGSAVRGDSGGPGEVALSTFTGVTREVTRLAGPGAVTARVMEAMAVTTNAVDSAGGRSVVWF